MRRILSYLREGGWMLLLICALLLAMCAGCTKTIYVPTESVLTEYRSDTLRQIQTRIDSVYHRDSIYIDGETIVKERWRERYVWRTDTVYKARVDTAYQYREITKLVEVSRPLPWWRKWLMWLGGFAAIYALIRTGSAISKRMK